MGHHFRNTARSRPSGHPDRRAGSADHRTSGHRPAAPTRNSHGVPMSQSRAAIGGAQACSARRAGVARHGVCSGGADRCRCRNPPRRAGRPAPRISRAARRSADPDRRRIAAERPGRDGRGSRDTGRGCNPPTPNPGMPAGTVPREPQIGALSAGRLTPGAARAARPGHRAAEPPESASLARRAMRWTRAARRKWARVRFPFS